MNDLSIIIITVFAVVIFAIVIIYAIVKSPFSYPYFYYSFDVSGKKNPEFDELIDEFLIKGNFLRICYHYQSIQKWKDDCRNKINKSGLKSFREKQYQKCLDDANAFQFKATRKRTRYSQNNNKRISYTVEDVVKSFSCGFEYIQGRNKRLFAINYECTLRQYNSKEQRKYMTKELRKEIMERDNYTCKICGKYMPDEVGLHIDHIIPVSKGGKSVPSNLQVLCSKCNGKKSNK